MSRVGLLHVCPENPRYFADASGRAVYLTGSHTWNSLSEQLRAGLFDYDRYLEWLARYNHNFFRLWNVDVFTTPDEGDNDILPYARTGPGLASDGRSKFDLTRFDPVYFQRLRSRVSAAGERGIYVGVMLFEGWWIWAWKEEGWRGHPFNPANNVNGIPASRLELHTLGNPRIMELQEAYVRRVLDTYKQNPPPADGRKVILTDTDHIQPAGLGPSWVWKSFTRGLNPIYMEDHDLFTTDLPAREAMGQTRRYAERMDLLSMEPVERIAATRFCLAHRQGHEFLIYQPDSGPFTVDLTGRERTYQLEWHNPNSGDTTPSPEPVVGGGWRLLAPPWRGDVVAYLRTREG